MSKEDSSVEEIEQLDVTKELMLKYRVNLGRNIKTRFSESFIYATHPKGFYLIDVSKTIEKLQIAARFLSLYEPEKVMLHSAREYASKALEMTSKLTGFNYIAGRFLPGMLTNYMLAEHREISVLFVIDHTHDWQAVEEAVTMRIPVVSIVDTNSDGAWIDLAIPGNNKGRSSIAAIMWALSVLVLRERGLLKPDEVIDIPVEEFMVAPQT